MADAAQSTPAVPNLNNGSDTPQLAAQVSQLQEECARLRHALAKTETERDLYRQAFLDQARAAREFEDLDIPTLQAMSAGPVEMIE